MSKVTIEITAEGWTTKVQIGEHTYSEEWKKNDIGAESTSGALEAEPGIPDEIYQSLSYVHCFASDIMTDLNKLCNIKGK